MRSIFRRELEKLGFHYFQHKCLKISPTLVLTKLCTYSPKNLFASSHDLVRAYLLMTYAKYIKVDLDISSYSVHNDEAYNIHYASRRTSAFSAGILEQSMEAIGTVWE